MLRVLAASLVRMNLYGCCEREPKVPAALTGSVWSERVPGLVMTRHHGVRKGQGDTVQGIHCLLGIQAAAQRRLCDTFPPHVFSRTGSGARVTMLERNVCQPKKVRILPPP